MIMALPSFAATTGYAPLGTGASAWRRTGQAVLFSTTVLCLQPGLESSGIAGTIERLLSRLKIPSKIPSGAALLKLVE
jgi:hypothetical protein